MKNYSSLNRIVDWNEIISLEVYMLLSDYHRIKALYFVKSNGFHIFEREFIKGVICILFYLLRFENMSNMPLGKQTYVYT